jgi:hypothetical protein
MLITEGIYDGEKVEIREEIPFTQNRKVFVSFPDDPDCKASSETKPAAQILLDLFGSWEDEREAEEIISEIRKARRNSARTAEGL